MLDIIVSGGLAVLPTGAELVDLGIAGGKIAAIGAPGSLAAIGAGRSVDAAGQIVIPGGIDPHVHCRWPIVVPGTTQHQMTDGPARVSQAALHGGTTTILDFALVGDGDNVQQAIERRQKEWAGDCHCDYAFHTMVQGKLAPELLPQLAEAVEAGHPSVKIFTTDITPSRKGRMVDFGGIWEVLKVLARAGGIAAIHAEDNDLVMHMYEKLIREDRIGFENMAEVHNTLSEDLAFNRVIRLAASIEGAALYMMHTSAATGVHAIAAARANGVPIYGETLHQYLLYNCRRLQAAKRPDLPHLPVAEIPGGPAGAMGGERSWRHPDRRHRRDLLPAQDQIAGPADRRHHRRQCRGRAAAQPDLYRDGRKARPQPRRFRRPGLVQRRQDHGPLPAKGRAGGRLRRRHRRCSTRASAISCAPPTCTRPITARGKAATSPPGRRLTMLRGKIVVDGSTFDGDLKDGQFLPRKVPDEVRTRPAV